MLLRGQIFLDERLRDSVRTHGFMDRRGGRMHLREQVRLRRLARFADVDHVPGPLRVPFVAVPRGRLRPRFDAPRPPPPITLPLLAGAVFGGPPPPPRPPPPPVLVAPPPPAPAWQ